MGTLQKEVKNLGKNTVFHQDHTSSVPELAQMWADVWAAVGHARGPVVQRGWRKHELEAKVPLFLFLAPVSQKLRDPGSRTAWARADLQEPERRF